MVSGHLFGLTGALRNQAKPGGHPFLVRRTGSQAGASELGGPDGSRDDEFPLCRLDLPQSNPSMCRHDRWGIARNLAGRYLHLESSSFSDLHFYRFGDRCLQVRPVSGQPGTLCLLSRRD